MHPDFFPARFNGPIYSIETSITIKKSMVTIINISFTPSDDSSEDYRGTSEWNTRTSRMEEGKDSDETREQVELDGNK